MARVISRTREQQRQRKAEAKRRAREQRRQARRVSVPGGHSGAADAVDLAHPAQDWRQQASEAEAVG
jgi:hypothetical protein